MAARRRASTAVSTGKGNDVVVVTPPAPVTARRSGGGRRRRRSKRRSGGGGRRSSTSDLLSRSDMWTLGGAGLLGWMQKSGTKIPTVLNLSPEASAGVIAWALGRFANVKLARDMAPGMLAIAVHRYASGTVPSEYVIGEDEFGTAYGFDDEFDDDDDDDEG